VTTRAAIALLLACTSLGCNVLLEDNPKFGASSPDGDVPPPRQPEWAEVHTHGDASDQHAHPDGPALLLSGAAPADDALAWLSDLADGGDVVILQTDDDPALGARLYDDIGGFDSVQTVVLSSSLVAEDPWVVAQVDQAEVVLLVGSQPVRLWWKYSPLAAALQRVWEREAVLGGLDAGASVLGGFVFTGEDGPLSSAQALEDPYIPSLTLGREQVSLPPLHGCLLEGDFREADRMGRLLGTAARLLQDGWSDGPVHGLGIDRTASLVLDANADAEVFGGGNVYMVSLEQPAAVCQPNAPLELGPLDVLRTGAGYRGPWPPTNGDVLQVSVTNGQLVPADPY
jgi:cyanophycinase-like exopeptidase